MLLLSDEGVWQEVIVDTWETTPCLSEWRKLNQTLSVGIGKFDKRSNYIHGRSRPAAEVGLTLSEQLRPVLSSQVDCKKRFAKMKDDPDVIGVILQRPATLIWSRCPVDRSCFYNVF